MLLWMKVSKMNSKKKIIKTCQAQIISLGGMIGGYVGLCGIQVKAAVGFNMWPCCPVTENSVWWKHSRAGQCFALYIELSHPCLSRAREKGHLNTLVHADKRLEIQWPSLPPSLPPASADWETVYADISTTSWPKAACHWPYSRHVLHV